MDNQNNHTDNLTLELFRFERGIFMALSEKISEALEKPNSFDDEEKAFWLNRARYFHEFAADANERIRQIKSILDVRGKAEAAHLN